jgi:hypothetical protein
MRTLFYLVASVLSIMTSSLAFAGEFPTGKFACSSHVGSSLNRIDLTVTEVKFHNAPPLPLVDFKFSNEGGSDYRDLTGLATVSVSHVPADPAQSLRVTLVLDGHEAFFDNGILFNAFGSVCEEAYQIKH